MLELDRQIEHIDEIRGEGGLWNSLFGGDDPVSLRSRAILKILFLMSEGEIKGFPYGDDIRRYIYVNDTPVVNPDNTENFRGVKATWRSGTQDQGAILGVSQGAAAPTTVGIKVTKAAPPVVRTIINSQADQIRVSLTTPGLSRTDNEGHIHNSEVRFKIYLATNGGAFILKVDDGFSGRTQGGYTRDYTIDVSGDGPWQIKVERVTDDLALSNTKEQNDLYWQSYTPIVERKFRYPNSALLYVEFDSAYFKAQPTITVKLLGVICRVPSNYDPLTRIYTGLWDGTFTRAWTNNPAWCLLELLTNPRFGTGNYISIDMVDKWSLYRIAKYCDELVPNGFSGQEPRFVYNNYLNTKVDAMQAIMSLLGQIRGVAYYAKGQILFNQDRPDIVPNTIFTLANTVCEYDEDGVLIQPNFTYDYVSLKEKRAKCHVFWYDPEEFGKRKPAYVDLFDVGYGQDFARYGDEVREIDLPGCTSEAEARRHGKWLLLTERLESKTVSFATGQDGMFLFPGDLIKVADPHEASNRFAGKIIAASTTTVTLDDPVLVGAGIHRISAIINGAEEVNIITNAPGYHSVINLATPYTVAPSVGSIGMVTGIIHSEVFRVISIGNPDIGKYSIIAVKHSSKYAEIDTADVLTPIIRNQNIPDAPVVLTVTSIPGGYFVGWSASLSKGVIQYQLEYEQENSGFWQPIGVSPGVSDAEVLLPSGAYKFRVAAISILGKRSGWKYSDLEYATNGSILSHSADGSIILSSQVNLKAGITYFLDTYCEEPSGASLSSLPSPYFDRRRIATAAGITNTIEVIPSYLGDRRTLAGGSYPNLEMYNNVTYVKLSAGSATLYDDLNYTGTSTVITPGTYINTAGQAPPKSVIVTGGTLSISQWQPGKNPLPSSTWRLTQQPLEEITVNGQSITIGNGSSVALTV